MESQSEEFATQRDWFPDHIPGVNRLSKSECLSDLEAMALSSSQSTTSASANSAPNFGDSLVSFLSHSLRNSFAPRSADDAKHQTKKVRLIEKLCRDVAPYQLLRQEHTTLRAALDQVRADISNYHDAIAQTKKETFLATRERDMYERQFHVLRQDFCDVMTTTVKLRQQYGATIASYRAEFDRANEEKDAVAAHLNDIRELQAKIQRLEADKAHNSNVGLQMSADIDNLQHIIQQCSALAFDTDGNPRMPYASVFSSLPAEYLETVRQIAMDGAKNTNNTETAGVKRKLDQISTDSNASTTSTTESTQEVGSTSVPKTETGVSVDKDASNKSDVKSVSISDAIPPSTTVEDLKKHPYQLGATPTGAEDLTESQAAALSPLERAQRIDLLSQHQHILDLTGVFNPRVFFTLLRRQADQIIDLQRQCSAETIKAQELSEQLDFYKTRLQTMAEQFELVTQQVEALSLENIEKDANATLNSLQLQALQEQTVLLKTNMKQLEVVKLLDEKRYQKLLECVECADNRASVAEDSVCVIMERIATLKFANDTLQEAYNEILAERNQLAEMVIDREEVATQRYNESIDVREEVLSMCSDVDSTKVALQQALTANKMIKAELRASEDARKQYQDEIVKLQQQIAHLQSKQE